MAGRCAERYQLCSRKIDVQHSWQFSPGADAGERSRLTESNAVPESAAFKKIGAAGMLDGKPGALDRSTAEALSKNLAQVFASHDSFLRAVQGDLPGAARLISIEYLNPVEASADARSRVLVESGDERRVGRLISPGSRMRFFRRSIVGD